ncbi:DUF4177 domain-containing protein [Ruminiclostridium herbifermentans]|uniref:DUF4177 domain-containing protein n=1 Tax=Ruminiclostridium herbifermentans TaxID=2488810 RepID=A0A4U7JFL1_9FIRM|nr:DUF4177 domain-containing protein [Ruminiclostridium herbifermentans]QNU67556.1 DUF4177 domain-containing protein [Ruminiclostridium herbifermentans]
MLKWEYKVIEAECKGLLGGQIDIQNFSDDLNILGKDGWEVASSFTLNIGQGTTRKVITILKRPC